MFRFIPNNSVKKLKKSSLKSAFAEIILEIVLEMNQKDLLLIKIIRTKYPNILKNLPPIIDKILRPNLVLKSTFLNMRNNFPLNNKFGTVMVV